MIVCNNQCHGLMFQRFGNNRPEGYRSAIGAEIGVACHTQDAMLSIKELDHKPFFARIVEVAKQRIRNFSNDRHVAF